MPIVGGSGVVGGDSTPVGVIVAISSSIIPDGFLECDGANLDRIDFPDLFASIGETYGAGDGSTTFDLPDMRGQFLRGLDSGRGVDSNRILGTDQNDAFQGHWHYGRSGTAGSGWGTTDKYSTRENTASYHYTGSAIRDAYTGSHGAARIGSETRPRNTAIIYAIKY